MLMNHWKHPYVIPLFVMCDFQRWNSDKIRRIPQNQYSKPSASLEWENQVRLDVLRSQPGRKKFL